MSKYYLVYRKSENNEYYRQGGIEDFYGWTTSKSVLDAFLEQRNKKNYIVERVESLDEAELIDPRFVELLDDQMIDTIELKSCRTGEMVTLFMTDSEKKTIEHDIQKMFDDIRSFDRIKNIDTGRMVDIYSNLIEKYSVALDVIGYRPCEISYVYDQIEDSYNSDVGFSDAYPKRDDTYTSFKSERYISDPSKIFIYSLESVIKILASDMWE